MRRWAFAAALLVLAAAPARALIATHTVVNEIMVDAVVEPGGEWVELYNPTTSNVLLDGMSVSDTEGAWIIPNPSAADDFVLAPKGYVTLSNNASTFEVTYLKNPDFSVTQLSSHTAFPLTTAGTFALANASDDVSVSSGGASPNRDVICWGAAATCLADKPAVPPQDVTLIRKIAGDQGTCEPPNPECAGTESWALSNAGVWEREGPDTGGLIPSRTHSIDASTKSALGGELTLTWAAAGADSSTGTLVAGSSFTIAHSSFSLAWATAAAQIEISTSGVAPGTTRYHLITGLMGATTYFIRLWTWDEHGFFSYLSAGATAQTRPYLPSAPGFSAVEAGSITYSWANVDNSTNTLYLAQVSTDNFTTINVSSETRNASTLFGAGGEGSALDANTTYYFRVLARNTNLVDSAFTSVISTITAPAMPGAGAPDFTGVLADSLTFRWSANGNAVGTEYAAQLSTDNFSTLNFSSATRNLSVLFGTGGAGLALNSNATYYFRVRTVGWTGLASPFAAVQSTITAPALPGTGAPVFSSVQVSSITFQWAAAGNPAGTEYAAQVSTDNFSTLNFSSATRNLAVLFGEGGAGQPLYTNATHYFRVSAVGWAGLASAFTAAASTVTLARLPARVNDLTAGTAGLTESARLDWTAPGEDGVLGNLPAGSELRIQYSDDPGVVWSTAGAQIVQSTNMTQGSAQAYIVSDLSGNTSYFFRLWHRNTNLNGWSAGLSNGATAYISPVGDPVDSNAPAWSSAYANARRLVSDSTGRLYLAYADAVGVSSRTAVSTSTDGGQTWGQMSSAPSEVLADGMQPSLAVDSADKVYMVWVQDDASDLVRFSYWNGGAWSTPVNVSATGPASQPGIVVDSYQTLHVLWRSGTSNVYYSSSTNLGSSWGTPELAASGAGLVDPSLALDRSNVPHAAFEIGSQIKYSSRTAGSWSAASDVAAKLNAGKQEHSQISVHPSGTIHVVFREKTATSQAYQVRHASRTVSGPFTATGFLSAGGPNNAGALYPGLSVDQDNNLHILFAHNALDGTDEEIAHVTNSTGGWSSPKLWTKNAVADSFPAVSWALYWNNGGKLRAAWTEDAGSRTVRLGRSSSVTLSTGGVSLLPPDAIADFTAAPGAASGETDFTWSAPAKDDMGAASLSGLYRILLTTAAADAASPSFWNPDDASIARVDRSTSGQAFGAGQALTGAGLLGGVTSYFRVLTRDPHGNWSALSNGATAQTRPYAPPLSFSNVTTGQLRLDWSAHPANHAAVDSYYAEISTDPLFSVFTSSGWTAGLFYSSGSLTANTTYYARARSRAPNLLQGSFSAVLSTSTLAVAPTAAFVVARTSYSVQLDWGPGANPEPGTDYELWRDLSASFPAPVTTVVSTSTSLHLGLAEDTSYYFKVRSRNKGGTFSAFNATISTKTVDISSPSAITNLTVTSGPANGLIALAFTAPADNPGTGSAARYVVKYSTDPITSQALFAAASTYANSWQPLAAGAAENRVMAGLNPGTTYYVAVEAKDEEGNQASLSNVPSAWASNFVPVPTATTTLYLRVSSTTAPRPDSPQTPDVLTHDYAGDTLNMITIAGNLAQEYQTTDTSAGPHFDQLQRWQSGLLDGNQVIYSTTVWTMVLTGVEDQAEQDVFWRASVYLWRNNAKGPVILDPISGPAEISAGSVQRSTPILNMAGNAVSILLEDRLVVELEADVRGTYAGLQLKYSIGGADGDDGDSKLTLSQALVILPHPSTAAVVSDIPGDSGGALKVWWSVSPDDGTGQDSVVNYRVYRSTVSGKFLIAIATIPATNTATGYTYIDGAADQPTTYYYTVRAFEGNIESPNSPPAFAYSRDNIAPAAITALGASTGTWGGEIVSTWTSRGDNGGAGVVAQLNTGASATGYYRIDATSDAAKVFNVSDYRVQLATWAVSPGSAQSYVLAGLAEGATYYLRLWTGDEEPNWSPISSGATAWAQTIPPNAVSDLAAITGPTLGRIDLSWTAAGDDGSVGNIAGGRLAIQRSSFTVTWSTTNAQIVVSTDMTQGSAQGYNLGSLLHNTTYFTRVWTADERPDWALGPNWSELSNETTAVTRANVPGAAAAPFSGVGESQLTAAWSADGNPPGTQYRLERSTAPDFSGGGDVLSAWTTATSSAPAGLASNTTFFFQIQARNFSALETAYFFIGSTITAPAVPGAGSPAFGAVETSSITFAWTAGGNPAGTEYAAQVSTDNFSTLNFSSATRNLSVLFGTGGAGLALESNATHYFRVRAVGWAQAQSIFAAVSSTITAPAVPGAGSPAFGAVEASSIAFQWNAGGNAAGTEYAAQISTDDFATLNFSSATRNLSALFGTGGAGLALNSNATHYFRVRAVGWTGLASSLAAVSSTITAPAAPGPGSPVFGSVELSSITFQWTANANPAGTEYAAQISTDDFATLNFSSATRNLSVLFGTGGAGLALESNTTHYFRVRAVGWAGAPSVFAAVSSTLTVPAAPGAASPAFSAVGTNAITFSWASGGNSAGTEYAAQVSTDNFATLNVSSATRNLSVLFGTGGAGLALESNATHYFRVRTVGWAQAPSVFAAVQSTITAPAVPGAGSPVFGAVELSSISFQWNAGGNAAGTEYAAQVSTDNFATLNFSSATRNLSVLFGTGGAGAALNTNATYYFRVKAVGWTGLASSFAAVLSTITVPAAPGAASPAFSAVSVSSITFAWTAGGNPAGTEYAAQVSTDNFATLNFSSATRSLSALFGTGGAGFALNSNTTHYFRVRAVGWAQAPSLFAAAQSTMTVPAAPGAGSPVFGAVETSSIAFSWTAGGNAAGTEYAAQVSTDNFSTVNFSSATRNLSVLFGTGGAGLALNSNATHYFRVRAVGWTGLASSFAAVSSTITAPAVPGAGFPAFGAVETSSITFAWTAGGNPAGTEYAAQVSTDNFSTLNFSSATRNLSALFGTGGAGLALNSNTTYYFRTKAVGWAGLASSFAAVSSTITAPAAPGPGSPAFGAVELSSIAFAWTAGGNPAGTEYAAQVSSDNFSTLNFSSATRNLSVLFGTGGAGLALNSNATHYFRVRTVGWAGLASPFAAVQSTITAPAVPGTGAPVFSSVQVSSINFQWSAAGNPAGSAYTAQISTDDFATLNLSSATRNLAVLFGEGGAGQPLYTNATYYFRVQAVGWAGSVSAFTAAASTLTIARLPAAVVDLTTVPAGASEAARLRWTAPGENGNAGNLPAGSQFRIQYSDDPNALAWSTASAQVIESTSMTQGAVQDYLVTGLSGGTSFYFRLWHRNANLGGWSALSNAATAYVDLVNFTVAAVVPSQATLYSGARRLVRDSTGRLFAAYIKGGVAPFKTAVATSTDNGQTWGEMSGAPAEDAADGMQPSLAVDSTDKVYMVWVLDDVNDYVRFSSYTAAGWGTAANLYTGAVGNTLPAIALDSYQNPHVVWRNATTSIRYSSSSDGGNSWSAAETVSAVDTPRDPSIALDRGNVPHLSWTAALTDVVSYSSRAAAGWSAASAVAAKVSGGNQQHSQISAAPSGSIHVVFREKEASGGFPFQVRHASRTASAGWSATGFLTSGGVSPNGAFYPGLAVDAAGAAHVVFAHSALSGADFELGYITNSTGNWSAPAALTVNAAEDYDGAVRWSLYWNNGGPLNWLWTDQTGSRSVMSSRRSGVSLSTGGVSLIGPDAVSNLFASTGPAAGEAVLLWSAPARDDMGTTSLSGRYRLQATTSAADAQSGVFWDAENLAIARIDLSTTGQAFGGGQEISTTTMLGGATYFFRLFAQDLHLNWSGLSNGATAMTRPYPPALAGFSDVTTGQLRLDWSGAQNAASVDYFAQLSTDSAFSVFSSSGWTAGLFYSSGTLAANTTYYARAKARNLTGLESAYSASGSTLTLPAAPASPAFSTVDLASITLSWSAAGNSAGTLYQADISTDNFATLNLSSSTRNSSVLFGAGGEGAALPVNTTHYFRVQAVGWTGLSSAYSAAQSTSTLPAAPASPQLSAVESSSAAFSWSANGNGPGTDYRAELSTDAFVTLNLSSATKNVSVLFGTGGAGAALLTNATHYFRVKAVGWTGFSSAFAAVQSTSTLAAVPGPGAPAFDSVDSASAAFRWTANGSAPGTEYAASVSTDGFATLNFSSVTRNISALFGATGAGAPLRANATHYFRVKAVNWNGLSTAYGAVQSTLTLAAIPAAGAPVFAGVDAGSIAFQWSAGGNAAGTEYAAQVSTDDFATLNFSSDTRNLSVLFGAGGAGSALLSNTTHYFRVRAVGWTGQASGFSVVSATRTVAATPGAASPPFTGAGLSSMTFNWAANGNGPQTDYAAEISTDDFATVNVSSATRNLFAWFGTGGAGAALLSNATYYFRVKVAGPHGYAAIQSTGTLPALPGAGAPAFAVVEASSIAFQWTAGGNAAGAQYAAQVSTDDFATLNLSSATRNLSVLFGAGGAGAALASNATYYFRVRTVGWTGYATDFTAAQSTITVPAVPGAPAFPAVELSSIAFQWSSGGNAAGTSYAAEVSTDAFATLNVSSATKNLSVLFGAGGAGEPLNVNATYYFRAKAVGWTGLSSVFSAAQSTSTLAAVPAAGAPVFASAQLSSITFQWASGGNPPSSQYRSEVSTDAFATVNVSSVTRNLLTVFGATGAGGPLDSNTTHYFRVRAVNWNGAASAYAAAAATVTLAVAPGAASPSFASVEKASSTFLWTSGGNGPGADYQAQISTDNFATLNFSSATKNLSVLFGAGGAGASLLPNATHYFRARTVSWSGVPSEFAAVRSTVTRPEEPGSTAFGGVAAGSASFSWSDAANPPGTSYAAEISTDDFATLNFSSATRNLSVLFGAGGAGAALAANATHYFRVKAVGWAQAASAFTAATSTLTLPAPPGAGAPAFGAVETGSIAFQWSAGGNAAGTEYAAQVSTDGFATINLSSATRNLSVLFGTGGAGAALIPNSTYYFKVKAMGWAGAQSAFAAVSSTMTVPAAPGAPDFAAVETSSISFSWTAAGNAPGTEYAAQVSTDGFATINLSSATRNLSVLFGTGGAGGALFANATYYFRVKAAGWAGSQSAFTAAVATITAPAEPGAGAPDFGSVETSSITFSWAAGGNAAGTEYAAQVSTDGFATLNFSSATRNLAALFGTGGAGNALGSNATHYFRVKALGWAGGQSAFAAARSTITLPASPAGTAFGAVAAPSILFSWSANGNPAGTGYAADVSTDNFATLNLSSATRNLSVLFGTGGAGAALSANTTHYFRTRAVGWTGLASGYTAPRSTATLAKVPGAGAPTFPLTTTSTITFAWSAAGNPAGSDYAAAVSTDDFATVNVSSATRNLSVLFGAGGAGGALASNVVYYFRVQAVNHNGLPTAFTSAQSQLTMPAVPADGAPSFAPVETASITFSWASGGNAAGTDYTAEISTDNFATLNFSSATKSLSALFGAGGAGAALAPNATHYLRVKAVGITMLSSPYSAPRATATLAATPGTQSPAFASVEPSSIAFQWTANGNPPVSDYLAQVSTDDFATVNASSATRNLSAVFGAGGAGGALLAGATHYFRVQAVNWNGLASAFGLVQSTLTAPNAPGASAPAFASVDLASVTFQWTANGNPPSAVYDAEISTDAFATLNVSSATRNLSVLFGAGGAGAALSANATYYFRVRTGGSGYGATQSTSTLPAVPGAGSPAFGSVQADAVTFEWTAGGNPAGSDYTAQVSTDGFVTINLSSATRNLSVLFGTGGAGGALASNATHYFRVKALNQNQLSSAYAPAQSTMTVPSIPGAAAFASVETSSIAFSWTSGGNAAGTEYAAQLSTDNFATLNLSSATRNVSVLFGTGGAGASLFANATYYFRVKAAGWAGLQSAFTAVQSTITLSTPPGAASPAFASVELSSISFQWTSGGNAAGAEYVADVSTDDFATLNLSSATRNLSVLFGAGGAGAALRANSTYYFRAKAVNENGSFSTYAAVQSTITSPAVPALGAPPLAAVTASAATLQWSANGNPPGTSYAAEVSTDDFATVNLSSRTRNLSVVFGLGGAGAALASDATHYFRVRTVGWAETPSSYQAAQATVTLPSIPAAGAPAFTGVEESSITFHWEANGNAPGTDYETALSTDAFATINISSRTKNLSVRFGAGGAGAGLLSHTTHFFRVRTVGRTGALSPFIPVQALSTLAQAPAAPSFTGVMTASVTAAWTPVPSAGYRLEASSTDFDGAGLVYSAATSDAGASVLSLTSLAPGTTYWVRVGALNWNGAAHYAAVGSTRTTSGVPSVPAGLGFSGVFLSSVTAAWSPAPGATNYVLNASTASDFTGTVLSSSTAGLSAGFGSLSINTTYYLKVAAQSDFGSSAFSAPAATATLAEAPGSPGVAAVFTTSVTVTWTPSTAAGYRLEASTTAFSGSGSVYSSSTANPAAGSLTIGGLTTNTTYWLRVAALNWGSVPAFAGAGSTRTAGAISAVVVTAVEPNARQAEIRLAYSDPNPAGTRVLIVRKAGSAPVGVPVNGVAYAPGAAVGDGTAAGDALAGAFIDTGLALGASYYYVLYAHDGSDFYSAGAAAFAILDLRPKAPGGLARTVGAGGLAATIRWTVVTANENDAAFADPGNPAPQELQGYQVFRATSATAPGAWRATLAASATSFTDAILGVNYFYYVAGFDAYGVGLGSETRIESLAGHLDVVAPNPSVALRVDQGAVSFLEPQNNPTAQPLNFKATVHPEDLSATVLASAKFTAVKAGDGLAAENLVFPAPSLTVTFAYQVADGRPVFTPQSLAPAGGLEVGDVGIYWYNGTKWVKLFGQVNTQNQTVSVQTANTGAFQVRGVARSKAFKFDVSGLSSRFITPNGDGRNDHIVFTFENPGDAAVNGKIFDLKGVFVSDMRAHPLLDPRFNIVWDGKSNGRAVPPGIYLYQVEGEGKRYNGTIVVIR